MKTSVSSHITVRGIIAYIFGILFALCLILTLLITSVEAVAYWMPEYYENEYRKYQVAETVQMEMEDLLEVTDQMMAYLRGEREDLHIATVVGGQTREFFNDREIAHMEDVRGLFLGGLLLRSLCIRGAGLCLILLAAMRARLSQVLPRPGDAGSRCLGTVHAGASAKADDTVASRPAVKPHRLLHIICGGVGGCLVVDAIGKPFVRQGLLQWTDESQTPDSLVCDNQGSAAAVSADDFGQSPHAPHCLRRPVGQEGKGDF